MLGAMPRRSGAYGYRRALQVLRRREICLQPDVCIMYRGDLQLRQSYQLHVMPEGILLAQGIRLVPSVSRRYLQRSRWL